MKRYIIFSVSFIVVFLLLQFASGLFLTLTYTPEMTGNQNMGTILPQETLIAGSDNPVLPMIFIAFLSASIAYFIPNKFTKTINNVE